jgi:hypothetical protein
VNGEDYSMPERHEPSIATNHTTMIPDALEDRLEINALRSRAEKAERERDDARTLLDTSDGGRFAESQRQLGAALRDNAALRVATGSPTDEPSPSGTTYARLNWWKGRCDELHEENAALRAELENLLNCDYSESRAAARAALGKLPENRGAAHRIEEATP